MSASTPTGTGVQEGGQRAGALQYRWGEIALRYGIVVVFVLLCIFIAVMSPTFFTRQNLANVLLQAAGVGIVAVGVTFVIIARGIDVSVGAVLALASAVGARSMVEADFGWQLGIVAMLTTGLAAGLVNGLATAFAGMPSFLVTLATLTVANGLALTVSGGASIYGLPPEFNALGGTSIGPIPLPVLLMILSFVAAHLVLTRTIFGRQLYAVGGNPHAAKVAGLRVRSIILASFVIAGFCAGLAGVVLTARFNSYTSSLGAGYEFTAIAAVVIGGTSLYGGKGTVVGTLIGVLLLAVINNGLNLLGVSPFYQDVVRGLIIFAAVLLDTLRTRYAARLHS